MHNTTQAKQYQGLPTNATPRLISWFSCGAASGLATKIMLTTFPATQVVRIQVLNEHSDNDRFSRDCEKWFGTEIKLLKSARYADCWDVWEKRRYLNGTAGALCTVELKKRVRQDFQIASDLQCFGFTYDETARAERFQENNPEVNALFPLIDLRLTKTDCFQFIAECDLLLPEMYRLGYGNANCVGCVKGGKGYWNRIRIDFPATFDRMSTLERKLGASCINGQYLDELPVNAGRFSKIDLPECGLLCEGGVK